MAEMQQPPPGDEAAQGDIEITADDAMEVVAALFMSAVDAGMKPAFKSFAIDFDDAGNATVTAKAADGSDFSLPVAAEALSGLMGGESAPAAEGGAKAPPPPPAQ